MFMFMRPLDQVWGTDIEEGWSCIIADDYWMLWMNDKIWRAETKCGRRSTQQMIGKQICNEVSSRKY